MRNTKEGGVEEKDEKRLRVERLKARAGASWKRLWKDALRERYGEERDGGRAPVGGKKGEKLAGRRPGAQSTLRKEGVTEADLVSGRGRGRQGHGSRAQPDIGRGDSEGASPKLPPGDGRTGA